MLVRQMIREHLFLTVGYFMLLSVNFFGAIWFWPGLRENLEDMAIIGKLVPIQIVQDMVFMVQEHGYWAYFGLQQLYKGAGFAGMVMAAILGSLLIAREVDSRTAEFLFSRPVSRRGASAKKTRARKAPGFLEKTDACVKPAPGRSDENALPERTITTAQRGLIACLGADEFGSQSHSSSPRSGGRSVLRGKTHLEIDLGQRQSAIDGWQDVRVLQGSLLRQQPLVLSLSHVMLDQRTVLADQDVLVERWQTSIVSEFASAVVIGRRRR